MAFYCNGKKGFCDCHPVCKHNCEYFDGSGGKHIDTNADRIRAMSDEELSVFLWEFEKEEIARTTEYALERRKITEWLRQPAEVNL